MQNLVPHASRAPASRRHSRQQQEVQVQDLRRLAQVRVVTQAPRQGRAREAHGEDSLLQGL